VIPDFAVGCRRLTPGPGYLEALCEDNVCALASTGYHRIVTARSGRLRARRDQACNGGWNRDEDGTHNKLDVIVCATGEFLTKCAELYPKNG
jgi:hypothetical protein